MKGKKMKGQFFLLAAFSIALLFYLGISSQLKPQGVFQDFSSDMSYLFKNIEHEYPKVLNFGLNVTDPINTMVNFTLFARNVTSERNINLSVLWLVAENSSSDLNITLGNFLGEPVNISLNISNTVKVVNLNSDSTNYTIFTNPSEQFNLTLSFNTVEEKILLEKYKVSLYFILSLDRDDTIVRGDRKL